MGTSSSKSLRRENAILEQELARDALTGMTPDNSVTYLRTYYDANIRAQEAVPSLRPRSYESKVNAFRALVDESGFTMDQVVETTEQPVAEMGRNARGSMPSDVTCTREAQKQPSVTFTGASAYMVLVLIVVFLALLIGWMLLN